MGSFVFGWAFIGNCRMAISLPGACVQHMLAFQLVPSYRLYAVASACVQHMHAFQLVPWLYMWVIFSKHWLVHVCNTC